MQRKRHTPIKTGKACVVKHVWKKLELSNQEKDFPNRLNQLEKKITKTHH